jgi:hypothetical protein
MKIEAPFVLRGPAPDGLLARNYLRRKSGLYAPAREKTLLYEAIGTPTTLGSQNVGGSASCGITTTANIVAGNLVVVAFARNGTQGISSVSDPSNTYTASGQGQAFTDIWYCLNAVAVSSGSLITVQFAGSETEIFACAAQVSGITAYDSGAANGNNGNGTSLSVTTGTLAKSSEIIFGAGGCKTTLTFTESSGFTNLYNLSNASASIALGYKIVFSNAAVTYNPTLTSSVVTLNVVAAPFEGKVSTGFNMPMLGM